MLREITDAGAHLSKNGWNSFIEMSAAPLKWSSTKGLSKLATGGDVWLFELN